MAGTTDITGVYSVRSENIWYKLQTSIKASQLACTRAFFVARTALLARVALLAPLGSTVRLVFLTGFLIFMMPGFVSRGARGASAGSAAVAWASEPTAALSFVILKDDNGKPVRNAAVVLHPVNAKGKQGRGGFELKTDSDGKTHFESVPYGKLRVQVLAPGFQTYGEDFDIGEAEREITVRLKRPQKQYSIYDDAQGTPKKDAPPQEKPQQ